MSGTIDGGCLCRAVRFRVTGKPMAVRTCWCRLCQYLGAGSATVNVCFATDNVATTGEVSWYASKADSGNDLRRGFCPNCEREVEMLTLASAAKVAGVSGRQLISEIAKDQVHSIEIADGHLMVCQKSLSQKR